MTNVPEDSYRTWTFFKTSERMKIECNGVQVWEIAFADDSESCAASFSKASHSFVFNDFGDPTFYRAAGRIEKKTISENICDFSNQNNQKKQKNFLLVSLLATLHFS